MAAPVYLFHHLWWIAGSLLKKRYREAYKSQQWKMPGGIMYLARKPVQAVN